VGVFSGESLVGLNDRHVKSARQGGTKKDERGKRTEDGTPSNLKRGAQINLPAFGIKPCYQCGGKKLNIEE